MAVDRELDGPSLPQMALVGSTIRLDPMRVEDAAELARAAISEDRSTFRYTWVPGDLDEMAAYVAAVMAERDQGLSVPFTVRRRRDESVVGSTRFLDLAFWPDDGVRTMAGAPSVVEIGATWYAPSVQGTVVNPEAKLLLLRYAFEAWHVHRVSLKTDARNARSRAAIAKLGAEFEGIRRAHVAAADGAIRDSAYYSILADEWPAVRSGLEQRLIGLTGTGETTP